MMPNIYLGGWDFYSKILCDGHFTDKLSRIILHKKNEKKNGSFCINF